jgi:hypothetical protein
MQIDDSIKHIIIPDTYIIKISNGYINRFQIEDALIDITVENQSYIPSKKSRYIVIPKNHKSIYNKKLKSTQKIPTYSLQMKYIDKNTYKKYMLVKDHFKYFYFTNGVNSKKFAHVYIHKESLVYKEYKELLHTLPINGKNSDKIKLLVQLRSEVEIVTIKMLGSFGMNIDENILI